MRLTIHQPAYLPYLGLLSKINASDKFIILDHVKFDHNSFDNRNRIRIDGQDKWLTIPVQHNSTRLIDTKIANSEWKNKHIELIRQAYKREPFFNDYFGIFKELLLTEVNYTGESLMNYCYWTTCSLYHTIAEKDFDVSYSSVIYKGKNTGSQMILDLCLQTGADEYLSGSMGKDYLDIEAFKKAGVKVLYHHWDEKYYLSSIHYLLKGGDFICKHMLTDFMTIEEARVV